MTMLLHTVSDSGGFSDVFHITQYSDVPKSFITLVRKCLSFQRFVATDNIPRKRRHPPVDPNPRATIGPERFSNLQEAPEQHAPPLTPPDACPLSKDTGSNVWCPFGSRLEDDIVAVKTASGLQVCLFAVKVCS